MKGIGSKKLKSLALSPLMAVHNLSMKYPAGSAEHSLMMKSASVTIGLLAFSSPALADGWAGMFETGGEQASRAQVVAAKLFQIAGFAAGGFGCWNWYKKGSDGDRSEIKAKQIVTPLLAGAALGGVGYLLDRTGETIGIAPSEYGRI